MPRGSRPGERRGGRQRGTPNKKTLIKNAVFLAAAEDPNRSPLDFMLALMRNSQVPLDMRIDMAAAAAPFVHARPEPVRKKGPDPIDLRDRLGHTGDLKFESLRAKPGAEGSEGVSPLNFLLGVMGHPEATPRQRVKAATVAARYTNPRAGGSAVPAAVVVEDKFGFKVDPELARAERDDSAREATLEEWYSRKKNSSYKEKVSDHELVQIGKRRAERVARVKFPDGYTSVDRGADRKRLDELNSKRRSGKKLTPEEDAEEAHLTVRVLNPDVKEFEWPMWRLAELEERFVVGESPLSAAEEGELKDLRGRYPEIAADVDKLDHRYRYLRRREEKIAEKAGLHWLDGRRVAEAKYGSLRDRNKRVSLIKTQG